jgi:hypothetical protein
MAVHAASGQGQQMESRQLAVRLREQNPTRNLEVVPANPAQEEGSFFSVAKKLMLIVLKHQDKRDPLSNRLFMKGSDFALFVINSRSEEVPKEALISHFIGLRAIFNEECRCENVENVWLVGSKAWEKRELDLYCKALSHYSPRVVTCIDLGAPHAFGNEILKWIENLERPMGLHEDPILYLVPTRHESTIALNELGVPVVVGLQAEEGDLITALAYAEPDKSIDIHTANRVLTEFNKRMNGLIQERKKVQFTEDLKKQNELLKEKLDERNNQRDKDIARQAESANKQIEHLTKTNERTVAHFDSAINERIKIEQQLTQGLEKREKELAGEKAENARQKVEITDLKASNSWLTQRVGGLQNQVNNMPRPSRGGFCIIS